MSTSDLFIEEIASRVAEKLRGVVGAGTGGKRWPEVMDINTAAEYIDRTREGMRGIIRKGLVPITRIDGRVQIRRCDLDRLVERNTI